MSLFVHPSTITSGYRKHYLLTYTLLATTLHSWSLCEQEPHSLEYTKFACDAITYLVLLLLSCNKYFIFWHCFVSLPGGVAVFRDCSSIYTPVFSLPPPLLGAVLYNFHRFCSS
ncbi:hypothetical protein OTU49_013351 [Cherax quadricarinatus]|uniref:Uncharacterized protein n=1 Tax=Cherax quadricarinatus TaxID=27406 RepID=A0AAW0VU23_CHEQU